MPFAIVPLVPLATVSALVAEKGELTTVINAGPGTVLIGHYRTLQQGDQEAIPLIPNQFVVNTGEHELYAALTTGSASIYKMTGIANTGLI